MYCVSNGVPHHPVLLAVASGRYLYAKYHSEVRSGGIEIVPAAKDGWSEASTTPPPSGEYTLDSASATTWEMPGVCRASGGKDSSARRIANSLTMMCERVIDIAHQKDFLRREESLGEAHD